MGLRPAATLAIGVLAVALGACASEEPAAQGSAAAVNSPASAPGPSQSAIEPGCVRSDVKVRTDNLQVVGVADPVYERLACAGSAPLSLQLAYISTDQKLREQAASAGVTLSLTNQPGAASMTFASDIGMCVISVSNAPAAKSLTCA